MQPQYIEFLFANRVGFVQEFLKTTAAANAISTTGTVLPKGVEPSNDPMLAARAAPYAVGIGRRLSEGSKQ